MDHVKSFNRDFSKIISTAVYNIKEHQVNR
jgi:hypothetical protein